MTDAANAAHPTVPYQLPAPRTPSARHRKRTPTAQPDEHPTPSKTKKVRPSSPPQATVSPTPLDPSWTTVSHKKKKSRCQKMTDTSTLGALTDIYGSPVETGLSGLQTPEPGNQPTPTTINSALLTPWTADELRLFDESQADIAAAAAATARALEFPPLPARSPETVDDAPTPRPLGSPHSTVAGLRQSRANANAACNGPPPLTDADVAMAAPAGLMEPQQTHPIMQPSVVVNGRRTLANGLVITEAPEGGRWPARYSFEHSLKGMHPGQRTAWLAKPQPTIIATAWRQKFTNNATLATTLLALIPRIINAPEARVSTPFRPDNDVLPHIPILHCTV